MKNYAYYEICYGCEKRLPGRNEGVEKIVESILEIKGSEFPLFYHTGCEERVLKKLKEKMNGKKYRIKN